jgi:hypothetical protein
VVQRHLPFATLSDEAYHPREPTNDAKHLDLFLSLPASLRREA